MNNRKFALSMVMKFAIFALIFGFFAMVLFQYYGPRLFRRADSIGYAVTLILYAIVYVIPLQRLFFRSFCPLVWRICFSMANSA